MYFSTTFTLLAAASGFASAQQNCQRTTNGFTVVPHDSLKYIPQAVRGGTEGDAITKYEPYLHIASGCRSYPAVDMAGQVSGGLQASGSSSGGCNDGSNQQTYARGKWVNGRYAIMYAWYFPKDQTTDGGVNGGHRHDWENVVVWISDPANPNPTVFGAAASGHGDYKKVQGMPQNIDGTHPQVEYFTNFPTNHELQFKSSPGVDLAMIDWDSLSDAARNTLNLYDFGNANVPLNDCNFDNNLGKAAV